MTHQTRRRKHHKCTQCGKQLPKIARQHGDPHCSAECARHYHGVHFPISPGPTAKHAHNGGDEAA